MCRETKPFLICGRLKSSFHAANPHPGERARARIGTASRVRRSYGLFSRSTGGCMPTVGWPKPHRSRSRDISSSRARRAPPDVDHTWSRTGHRGADFDSKLHPEIVECVEPQPSGIHVMTCRSRLSSRRPQAAASRRHGPSPRARLPSAHALEAKMGSAGWESAELPNGAAWGGHGLNMMVAAL